MNRRQLLLGLAGLGAAGISGRAAAQERFGRRGDARPKPDPMMGFLGFGPDREADRIDFVRARIAEFGARYGYGIRALTVADLERADLKEFAGFFVYGAGVAGSAVKGFSERAFRNLNRRVRKGGAGLVALHEAAAIDPSGGERTRNQERRSGWVRLIGGESLGGLASRKGRVRMADRSVPGMTQLRTGFELEERWLAFKNFDPTMHVVMVQRTEDLQGALYQRPDYPLTWLRYHGKGRVFYSGLGYERAGWETDPVRRCVVGGALWVLRDTEADVSANLLRVAPKAIQAVYPV